MSFHPFESDGQVFPLQRGRKPVVLEAEGVDHPDHLRGRRRVFTRYDDITHLATSTHAAWIGSKQSVYILGRSMFAQSGGPENLVRALARRIADLPGGGAQLARMARVEEIGRAARPLRAVWALAGICVAVFGAQLWFGSEIEAVASFDPHFFRDGDIWRVVTANLVHAAPDFPIHLGLNMLALVVVGALVERPLGPGRTVTVMGISGVAAMLANGLSSDLPVVGASGIVFGLVGAAVWLEFTWAERLPAWWRYPRRSLLVLIVLNGAIGFLVPIVSGSAHLGGFAGGLAAAALLARPSAPFGATPRWVAAASALVVVFTGVAVSAAAWELSLPGEYMARQAARLASMRDVTANLLNDTAWRIAISPESSDELLTAALALAERAVAETERSDPNVLDTLAEVQFALGRQIQAIDTIDEAIARAPDEPYFREQRRRFTGERDAEDRPGAPLPSWLRPVLPDSEPEESTFGDEPGLTV